MLSRTVPDKFGAARAQGANNAERKRTLNMTTILNQEIEKLKKKHLERFGRFSSELHA